MFGINVFGLFRFHLALLTISIATFSAAQGAGVDFRDFWGPRYRAQPQTDAPAKHAKQHPNAPVGWVRHWNEMAINASGLDHTPVALGESRIFGEQLGPARSSRAMAIVHIAIFDALNAIVGGWSSRRRGDPNDARQRRLTTYRAARRH